MKNYIEDFMKDNNIIDDEEFQILTHMVQPIKYHFRSYRLIDSSNTKCSSTLIMLLEGKYKIVKLP